MAARLQDQLKQAKDSVASAAKQLQSAGFKAGSRVIESEIRPGTPGIAAGWHADLIVLGSHGKKGLSKFLLGSVSEFLARHAECSVLIVRMPG